MLTDTKLKALKPREKLYRVADSGGLCIEVRPTGSKLWRYRYRYMGVPKMLGFGEYPTIPLAGRADPKSGRWIDGARDRRDEARRLLADGIDPSAQRKEDDRQKRLSATNTFEAVAK